MKRSSAIQIDLFRAPPPVQQDLLAGLEETKPQAERMVEIVRPRLDALLAEACAARAMPWTTQRAEVFAIIFHNMANWLPEGERDARRAAFRLELDRLGLDRATLPDYVR